MNLRERLVKEGIESALKRKPSKPPPRQTIIDGGLLTINRGRSFLSSETELITQCHWEWNES
ncbi:hypothetical protein QHH03_11695, partial [Aphanizomenon sp. 202]|nr:hypothetical protein [Aphanizomenon sp. 202]